MKVLIAEDDIVSRHVLKANLQKWDYEVVVAKDGLEAWNHFQGEDIAPLAILDWMMPEMDGLEVCRRIRKRTEGDYVYIILLTAKEGKTDIVTGLDAGANDYVVKPFDKDELRSRVKVGERMVLLERSLQEANRQLKISAMTDSLTELYNHGAVLDRFSEEMSRSRRECLPLSVVMADIDFFKSVNDNYGHLAGDKVLKEVARRIKSACRPYDSIGRYGGEEFLVVLPGTDEEEAWMVAERLHDRVRHDPIQISAGSINVSISVGVGTVPWELEVDEEAVIRAADAALYRAKEQGRDRVIKVKETDFVHKTVLT